MTAPILLCFASAAESRAQSQAAGQPVLEIASVRVAPASELDAMNRSGRRPEFSLSGNMVTLSGATLISLIRDAYNVRAYQVSGAPSWINDASYDIRAKAEGNGSLTLEGSHQLLQALLAGRFQLRTHRETKELAVCALVAGSKGPRLKASSADKFSMSGFRGKGKNWIDMTHGTMAQLGAALSVRLDRPVVDRTELGGSYDFRLEFASPDLTASPDIGSTDPGTAPSIFVAVQDQLGLEQVEKPSEN